MRGAIPVSLSITETSTDGNRVEALSLNSVDYVWDETIGSLLERIMSESNGTTGIETLLED